MLKPRSLLASHDGQASDEPLLHQLCPLPLPSPIMSKRVSCTPSPCVKPLAQLFPAPPPSLEMKVFSGLNKLLRSEFWIPWITLERGEGSQGRT